MLKKTIILVLSIFTTISLLLLIFGTGTHSFGTAFIFFPFVIIQIFTEYLPLLLKDVSKYPLYYQIKFYGFFVVVTLLVIIVFVIIKRVFSYLKNKSCPKTSLK